MVIAMMTNRIGFATLDEEVSGVVRAEIARHRRDQKEISTILGIHPNVLGRKVRGEVAFSTGELVEVANALGLSAAEIMREAEQRFRTAHMHMDASALAATAASSSSSLNDSEVA